MEGANSVEEGGMAASLTGRSAVEAQGVWLNFRGEKNKLSPI